MYRGRILAIADVPFAASGYGVQTNILMSRLAKRGWDVYQIGGNYWFTGAEEVDAEGCLHYNGIKVIRNFEIRTKGALGLYGSKEFQRRVFDDLQPDVVWTFNDFYRVAGLVEIGQDFLDRWVHYHPMDNPYGGGDWIRYMNCLRFLVFCSSFGWKTHAAPLSDVSFKDALYLAVPGDVFRPLPDKDAVKERHGLRGSFVITTVGRHQPRKMIYQTAYAVGPFLQAHLDAVWVCKCDPDDPTMRDEPEDQRDLRGLMARYGVADRVIFESAHLPEDQMNDLYNTGDVFMHTSGGEGFGVPQVESMLAGVPCILTDNTTSPELTNGWDFGLPVPVKERKRLDKFATYYDCADVDVGIKQLEFAYDDWKKGSAWLKAAGQRAREFHLKWCDPERIVSHWEEIFWRIMRYNNKVLWHSYFGRGVGFTAISETVIPALEKMGYDVYINDWGGGASPILEPYFRSLYDKYLKARETIDFAKHPQIVCWLMQSFPSIKGDWRLGWSLCESTKLHAHYQQVCNDMDYLITSSEFNRKVQEQSGIACPIRIVPPCVDPEMFPDLARPPIEGKVLTFLHIGVYQERKNPWQTVEGYCKAFPPDGKTRLIYKSNDFGTLDNLKAAYGDRPDIEWIYTSEKPLDQQELLKLYLEADVYVNLSHGEGIGMPDLEAMATGLPVIGSNWDTRALFLNEETGWPLKVVGMEQAYRLTVKEDCGEWACFDTEEYVKVLKEIAQSPAVVREKGKRAADSVRARFTPTAAAEALDAVLMEVYERKRTPAGAAYDENYYSQVHKYHEGYYENAAASILAVTGRLQGSVLEVGCGRGYLMKHLLAKGVSVTGIDISDYAVANPLPECAGRIFKGDVLDIPYPDGTFDWGVAFSLLEHIPEKGVAKALQELKRVCKKLFLQIAIPLQPGHEKQIASEDHTHCTLYPIEWWRRRLDEAGLQISLYDGGMSMVVEPRESIMRIFPSDRILVGIPTRDRAQHLAALLRSLLGQSFKQFDVCIVDDSRVTNLPNEAEVTDALNALYMQGHSWFAFRGPAINQAVAHNNVLRFALEKGYKLVLRVDDDVTLEADFLEIMFNEFLKDEECQYAAIGGIYLNPNMRPELQVAPANWREVADFAGSVRHCVYWAQVMRYPDAIEYRDDIQHLYSTYVYRTRLMESVGGFPTDLSAIAHREETIPLYALWLQGYRLKIVTRAVGWHWLAKEGGIRTTPPDKAREMAMADNEVFNRRIAELEARYGKGADHPAHQGPA